MGGWGQLTIKYIDGCWVYKGYIHNVPIYIVGVLIGSNPLPFGDEEGDGKVRYLSPQIILWDEVSLNNETKEPFIPSSNYFFIYN